jgi:Peptidase M1 N-terminal domain
MNNTMAGFYRSKYKPTAPPVSSVPKDEEFHYMFSTQFESCDARRAFPCFDEPNLKATFDFEIEVPEDLVALSNMPEKEVKKGSRAGLKIVAFDRTPVMSTYVSGATFPREPYWLRLTRDSCLLGLLGTSSIRRISPLENTTETTSPCVCTPQGA